MDRLRLAELCASTSLFTDLGTGQPVEHGLRTCVVAMRLAAAMDAEAATRREVYYVSLLRFLGCTADSHTAARLTDGDEIRLFRGMAPVTMGSNLEELRRLSSVVSEGVSWSGGLMRVIAALTAPGSNAELLGAHCEVASRLASDMGLPDGVSAALAMAYARWDGHGVPEGAAGDTIPRSMRICIVARDIELWARETDTASTERMLQDRRGRAYDPDVVAAAVAVGIPDLRPGDADLWELVLDLEPEPHDVVAGTAIDAVLRALGDFADLKAPRLSGHSRRVARIAVAAGEAAGLGDGTAVALRHAAMVHDVGLVAVPAGVWTSPSGPGPAGSEQIQAHPLWSRRLLARCHGLGGVAQLAGAHHERLDGTGYPAGASGVLGRGFGLLACAEFYDERTMEQPSGVRGWAREIADEMVRRCEDGELHRDDVRAVLEAVGERAPIVDVQHPAGLTDRELEVLRLIAGGRTNRAIAAELGISAKTVGAHVEHIYDKADVRSRAAATLYAAQHDLLG